VIDGSAADLKKLYIPVLEDELLNRNAVQHVEETSSKLSLLNYRPQVNARNINLFFMEEGVRERIVITPDGHYEVVNTDLRFTKEMMLELLHHQPERFSPNVVLRPLYQEYILPGLAYVGGPGEISYWMQYKSLFQHYKVHFPVLVLRDSIVLSDASLDKKMNQFGISIADLFLSSDELVRKFIREEAGELDIKPFIDDAEKLFRKIRDEAVKADPTLAATVSAEEQKLLNSIDLVKRKMQAALKRKHETSLSQLKAMKDKVFPSGELQERHLNFIPFYLADGQRFMDMLKQEISVFRKGVLVLTR
jgi:bacillithiol biosynthesis cysteine-adding enzyme BshC